MYVIDAVSVIYMHLCEENVAISADRISEAALHLNNADVSQEDVRSILKSKFSCTTGRSYRISTEIKEFLRLNSSILEKKSIAQGVFAREFLRWRRGDLDPCQLINLIETALFRQDISAAESSRLIDQVLHEGGHLSLPTDNSSHTCPSSITKRPISFLCSKFSYLSITALSSLNKGCLTKLVNAVALLSPIDNTSVNYEEYCPKYQERCQVDVDSSVKASLNPLVSYCRVYGTNDLLSSRVGIDVCISEDLSNDYLKCGSYRFATLFIHDTIVNHQCTMEVIEVLGVDSDLDQSFCPIDEAIGINSECTNRFHFCVLFQGKPIRGRQTDAHVSSYGEAYIEFENDKVEDVIAVKGYTEGNSINSSTSMINTPKRTNDKAESNKDDDDDDVNFLGYNIDATATSATTTTTTISTTKADCGVSTENDEKENVDLSPLYLQDYLHTRKKYYMLYCEFDGNKAHIIHTVKIDGMIKDQLPSFIKMQKPLPHDIMKSSSIPLRSVYIGGTCGCLLGIDLMDKQYKVFPLTIDDCESYDCGILGQPFPRSHSSSACITAIDCIPYCKSEYCNPDLLRRSMASGDHYGLVCLWSGSEYQIEYDNILKINVDSRVISLRLSPYGNQILVNLRDRLLLLGISREMINGKICKTLYIQSVLDSVKGYRTFYACDFINVEQPISKFHTCISIWKVMEESNSSCVFTNWEAQVPVLYDIQRQQEIHNNQMAEMEVIQMHTDYNFHSTVDIEFKATINNAVLEASKALVSQQYEQAWEAICSIKKSNLHHTDESLLLTRLRIASAAILVPEEILKIVDNSSTASFCSNDAVPSVRLDNISDVLASTSAATRREHSWLFHEIITDSPTSINQESLPEWDPLNGRVSQLSSSKPFSTSALLVNLIPYSVDMGKVFCINTALMMSATTWRSDAFSSQNNLIKIHNLCKVTEEKIYSDDDSLDNFESSFPELLCSFNPIKSSCWNLQSLWVSAVSLSQFCTSICVSIAHVASDISRHCDDCEIGIWSLVNSCTHLASIPLCSKSPPVAIDWHASDTMLAIWISSTADSVKSWTPSYFLVNWNSLVVLHSSRTFSQDVLCRHICTSPSSPITYRAIYKTNKDRDVDDMDVQDIVDTAISMKPVVIELHQRNHHDFMDVNNLNTAQSIYMTRRWVFDNLTNWLDIGLQYTTSDSDDESLEQVYNRIWALHAPAGFGKSLIIHAIADLHQDRVVARFDCSFPHLPSSSTSFSENIGNHTSLILSIAQQLCAHFGEEYKKKAIVSLSSHTRRLVKSVCEDTQRKCNALIEWRNKFLASGGFFSDGEIPCLQARLYGKCMKAMIERIQFIQTQYKPGDSNEDERIEFCALCELLTSFQVVVFGGISFLLPQFSMITVKDLFESLISHPLRSYHLSSVGNDMTFSNNQYRLVLIDGITQFSDDSMVSKFIRMLALNSPSWLKIILTSRNNGGFVKELGDLHPRIVHLYGDNHFEDMKMIFQSLLIEKNYQGSIAEGVEILLKKADGDMRCINFLRTWLQSHCTQDTILHMSLNIDFQKFSLVKIFVSEASEKFKRAKQVLEVYCASYEPPPVSLVCAAIDVDFSKVWDIITNDLSELIYPAGKSQVLVSYRNSLKKYLTDTHRIGQEFWIDARNGHNAICSLYLRFCSNKSIAVDYLWQNYLKMYGPSHLRQTTRSLRNLTYNVRKIDETCGIRGQLPYQLGYVVGLEEMYARRVGLCGHLPTELGQLQKLRILSMGNNQISGTLPSPLGRIKGLQRIVLHQNKLSGAVPIEFDTLGCIVNLAGNRKLLHGDDVPNNERLALNKFYRTTDGTAWCTSTNWNTSLPVSTWYKVGVLASHVHSLVMSSNNMSGYIPTEISQLKHLRMIELASMPYLKGKIPSSMCKMMALRRLCICRCGIGGRIPQEIGNLKFLEELQLFGNNFIGSIPSSLSELKNLRLLSLGEYTGGNRFDPAPIPECISRLVHIEAIFIANCNLIGSIPEWIGNLGDLKQLDVQSNDLSGKVPTSFGKLTNLLYLNIKDNERLNGILPIEEMSKLIKLNRLSMVHCSFENVQEAVDYLQIRLPRCRIWT